MSPTISLCLHGCIHPLWLNKSSIHLEVILGGNPLGRIEGVKIGVNEVTGTEEEIVDLCILREKTEVVDEVELVPMKAIVMKETVESFDVIVISA